MPSGDPAEHGAAAAESVDGAVAQGGKASRSMHILVVEDNLTNQLLTSADHGDCDDAFAASAPGPVEEKELPVPDNEMIEDWKSFLAPDKFDEFIETQLGGARLGVVHLLEAGPKAAFDDTEKFAHDLKGVFGNLGMAGASHLAMHLESACSEDRESKAQEMVPGLGKAVTIAAAALDALYARPARMRDAAK